MMTTESSSLVGRRSPALLAGFSFVAKVRLWPLADCDIGDIDDDLTSAFGKSRHSVSDSDNSFFERLLYPRKQPLS